MSVSACVQCLSSSHAKRINGVNSRIVDEKAQRMYPAGKESLPDFVWLLWLHVNSYIFGNFLL